MRIKNVRKRIMRYNPPTWRASVVVPVEEPVKEEEPVKNKKEKKEKDMTLEQIEKAETLAKSVNAPKEVKVVKKDKGLIERTESAKIVLTEDNRQVLND